MKPNLLFRTLLCCSFLLSFVGVQRAWADHLAAVDLSAQYIGTGPSNIKYLVTLKIYKICEPDYSTIGNYPNGPYTMNLGLFNTDYVTISSASGNFSIGRQVQKVGPSDTLDQLCGTYKLVNSCRELKNFKIYPAFIRHTYQDTVTVPLRTTDLKFTWSSCCRNAGVQNITNTGGGSVSGAGILVEASINNVLKYNNSTPVYTADPIPYICANRLYNYVNAPVDIDNDNLQTVNWNPQTAGFPNPASLPYALGYSFTNPIDAASPGYNLNATNGTATFNPNTIGKYVLAFRTYDRDKTTGAILGYASRDVQVSVLSCAGADDPTIDSIVQSPTGIKKLDATIGNNIIYTCPGAPISFKVNAHVNNPTGFIILRPLPSSVFPPGLTFNTVTNSGNSAATTTFNWTPTASDYGDHIIAMEALDSGCANAVPIVPKVYFVFTIRVLGPGLDAGPDLLVCPLGERPAQLSTVNGSPTANYTWTNLSGAPGEYLTCTDCRTPKANPPVDYTYVVTTDEPEQLCKNSDTVKVLIDNSVTIDAPQDDLLVCRPGYVQLQSVATGPSPYANVPCGVANPISCATEDLALVGFGSNVPSAPQNTPFFSGRAYHKYQFIVKKADILAAGLYSGTINGLSFFVPGATIVGTNAIQNFNVSLGCTQMEDYQQPVTNSSFNPNVTTVATIASLTLTPNAWNQITFTTPYSWDTTQNLLVDICMGLTGQNVNGNDVVTVVPGAAIQKYDNGINVCGGNAPAVQYYNERPVVRFNYCHTPALPFDYHWVPGNNLKDSNAQNPYAFIPRSINYEVFTVGRNGCRVKDALHIVVPDHHLTVGPIDTIACLNQIVPLHATGGDAYKWFEIHEGAYTSAAGSLTCIDCADPVAKPPVTTTYAVVYSNNVHATNPINPTYETGCPDTLTVTVFVNPLPVITISNQDTTIKYGKSVQLYAHGAQWYSWSPAGSLTDPNSGAPIAHPVETTTYVVYGKDMNGCVSSDSVQVAVDYRENLMVPTAFTPNGDGRNDVFKPVNLGFRRLMEFRVFNRWGQEVFSTTDANAGWNGKWKGEDAELGAYQYIIRIGYPDQMTETFKGDVTLVR